jgi:glycosyltransferase involved in cell wall biosynthesis
MDLFLFPSFMEGLSVSMVEAQCAGLPCVVSDTIPTEVSMTDLVSFLSLKAPVDEWVKEMEFMINRDLERENYPSVITQGGYDIRKNAEWLQNYYLEQWQKH